MAKNILICDDAAFMRMMIKDILTKNGYNIVGEAENGAKAVEKYAELKPDLVLMDITMPEMDGIEALKKRGSGLKMELSCHCQEISFCITGTVRLSQMTGILITLDTWSLFQDK